MTHPTTDHDDNRQPIDSEKPTVGKWVARIDRIKRRSLALWHYWSAGVWRDTSNTFKVGLVKTINISVRSFMSADLQSQACALTYRTVLAVVPALAMAFAICRGFGYSDQLTQQLYHIFPSQHQAIDMAIRFVDSYLEQASEGIFVGVGIIFLLWTLISLLGNVEDSFNTIWQVRQGRTIWRKVTDYLAIFLVLPVLMICAGGLSLMMTSTLKKILFLEIMAPAVTVMVDIASYVMTWLFFAGAYMLIPNAKVRFVNALIAGVFVGTAFQVIQWIFLSGQMYVTKYNAIYGSFSFVPLMLIWMQLSWLVTLIGALLCYASQNVGQFNYYQNVENISIDYRHKVTIAVLAIIVKRFVRDMPAVTSTQLGKLYNLPGSLVKPIVTTLNKVGLIVFEESDGELEEHPLVPGIDVSQMTLAKVLRRLHNAGDSDFLPGFDERFPGVITAVSRIDHAIDDTATDIAIQSLNIDV